MRGTAFGPKEMMSEFAPKKDSCFKAVIGSMVNVTMYMINVTMLHSNHY